MNSYISSDYKMNLSECSHSDKELFSKENTFNLQEYLKIIKELFSEEISSSENNSDLSEYFNNIEKKKI